MAEKDENTPPNFLQLFQSLLDDHLGKAEFTARFKTVVEHVQATDAKLAESFKTLANHINQSSTDSSASIAKLQDELRAALIQAHNAIDERMGAMEARINSVKDGDDADSEEVILEVLARLQFPEQKEIILDTPEEIRNKLELLQDDERLEQSAIKNLLEDLEKLRKEIKSHQGGSIGIHGPLWSLQDVDVSGITVGQSIKWDGTRWIPYTPAGGTTTSVYGEIPTDSGDHTNFTLAHSPVSGTFRLYRGGARQNVTDDFTQTTTALVLNVALATGEVLQCDYDY